MVKLDQSFMVPTYSTVCSLCKHFKPEKEGRVCDAFSDIPLAIWNGDNKHRTPFRGDHGIQFESAVKKSDE